MVAEEQALEDRDRLAGAPVGGARPGAVSSAHSKVTGAWSVLAGLRDEREGGGRAHVLRGRRGLDDRLRHDGAGAVHDRERREARDLGAEDAALVGQGDVDPLAAVVVQEARAVGDAGVGQAERDWVAEDGRGGDVVVRRAEAQVAGRKVRRRGERLDVRVAGGRDRAEGDRALAAARQAQVDTDVRARRRVRRQRRYDLPGVARRASRRCCRWRRPRPRSACARRAGGR